ncbi:uncharacterized protein DDB_G0283697-like [Culex pipiens pallens]|uniref:uncharacterized protein DDB_G0283697-like n=1 Tax=Culex pipiens pallens TaxID=42434 RepID=UPI0022AAF9B5|nr:uncharacterized protein DDB_G0283697-like [Culex pipiens pallens]
MSPDVLKVTLSQYRGPLITSYSGDGGGVKGGEAGYVKSNSETGSGGYRHKESFHTKDGNDYEHERQEGYGESKGEEVDHGSEVSDGHAESERKNDETDEHSREEVEEDRNYEVTEEDNNDHTNPQQHTTYGVAPTKQTKKKIQPVPEFGTRLTLPKKTSHKKNHNGYETVIYHDNEQKGFEKGYDRRHGHNSPPKSVVVTQKDEDYEEPREEDREDEEEENVREDDEKTDHDHQEDQNREEYDENYNSYKYGNDFAKNYYDNEERESEDRRNERRGSARDDGPDYDAEVDKEQIDETANEDKYYGDEYDDDDYRRRQYEYASEADYDAQR